jgi:crotonobetainyl-CoA:carnitine CoA-transferase CaiB-like acyl-CoA transferase
MLHHALDGIHVIEVAAYLPGPVCTAILASLGARVTKISRPGGDPLRGLPYLAPAYAALNGAKAELELDLRRPEAAAALRDMAASADVLVDGLRPGALDRLGLGAAALGAANPRLIYCALSGFGLAGGEAERAGHDLNFVALSGALAAGPGEPAIPAAQLSDMLGGMAAANAILAALHARAASGEGCVLDAPLLGAARWLMAPWHAAALAGGPGPAALAGAQACYRLYRTADGRHLAVGALEPHFWARFCAAVGRPELTARQFDADQEAVAAAAAAAVAGRTLAEWAAVFAEVDACVTPVLTVAEAAQGWAPGLGLPAAATRPPSA